MDTNETEFGGTYIPKNIIGDFELKNIDVSYQNVSKPLFEVSMVIKSNTVNATIGLCSAGKNTIVNLLDKFQEAYASRWL